MAILTNPHILGFIGLAARVEIKLSQLNLGFYAPSHRGFILIVQTLLGIFFPHDPNHMRLHISIS